MQLWIAIVFLLYSAPAPSPLIDDLGSGYSDVSPVPRKAGRGVSGSEEPVAGPSAPTVIIRDNHLSSPPQAHWYEPPNPLGLETFTSDKLPWMAKDAIGFRYTGPLRAPFAEQLRKTLLTTPRQYNHVLLELDSDGGDLAYVEELVDVLGEVKGHMTLTTRVTEGSLCASGCIPVFLQGDLRKASGSSIWVFHGARSAFTNIPDPAATDEYLDLLSKAGMTSAFRATLTEENRIYRPGSFILSGHELFNIYKSGIITELMPTWREETPIFPSGIGPR